MYVASQYRIQQQQQNEIQNELCDAKQYTNIKCGCESKRNKHTMAVQYSVEEEDKRQREKSAAVCLHIQQIQHSHITRERETANLNAKSIQNRRHTTKYK